RMETAVRLIGEMELRMRRMDPLAIGRRAQRPVKQKLSAFVTPVLAAFGDRLDEAGITVEPLRGVDPEVELSVVVVQQVLANLLDNSIFWLGQKEGARVLSIYLNRAGFVVVNNGPKIPETSLEQVFEPHFTTRPEASGMGLTLCRDLLLTVGGRITVSNGVEGVMWTLVVG
ncbi:MAG: signal transduction histidine kinase, partial [Myxococcota bacterium]